MKLRVLHVDNHLLAVAKPAGVPCVPDDSGDASLLDLAKQWVRAEFSKPGEVFLGVVHRLDRPVSGVVLFARTSKAAARLAEQFRTRSVLKSYAGVSEREPRGARDGEWSELEQWLSKDEDGRRVDVVAADTRGAQHARTRWRVAMRRDGLVHIDLEPLTGRPHQLRVACASLGAPLMGDLKYGAERPLGDKSVALHALRLEVEHPTRGERMAFECEPPPQPWWSARREAFAQRNDGGSPR